MNDTENGRTDTLTAARPENPPSPRPEKGTHERSAKATRESDIDASSEAFGDATARAEAMIDDMGKKAGHYLSVFGREVSRMGARLREEAEDIWAEAQALRRGEGIHPHD